MKGKQCKASAYYIYNIFQTMLIVCDVRWLIFINYLFVYIVYKFDSNWVYHWFMLMATLCLKFSLKRLLLFWNIYFVTKPLWLIYKFYQKHNASIFETVNYVKSIVWLLIYLCKQDYLSLWSEKLQTININTQSI